MAFKSKQFMSAKFTPREEEVPVPDMRDFFPDGEDPVWKIRGITGAELGQANEAVEKNRNIANILEGLVSHNDREKIDSVKQLVGIDERLPNDIAKRIEMLQLGSVDPVVDLELALKICETFPIEFFEITNKITILTGRGHVPGKVKPSGQIQKSK